MIKSILVPVDGSECCERAVRWAIDLAQTHDAAILFVSVLSGLPAREQLKAYLKTLERASPARHGEMETIRGILAKTGEDQARQFLDQAERSARDGGVAQVRTLIVDGDPAAEILQLADEGRHDLIIIGRRGLGGFRGLLMGSVSRKVCAHAKCPVLTVK